MAQTDTAQITGRVTATNATGIQLDDQMWWNFSQYAPIDLQELGVTLGVTADRHPLGDSSVLQGREVALTFTAGKDGSGRFIRSLALRGGSPNGHATDEPTAAPTPPRQRVEYDPSLSPRDYLNARMSALKSATHWCGAQVASGTKVSTKDLMNLAEINLAWLLQQSDDTDR